MQKPQWLLRARVHKTPERRPANRENHSNGKPPHGREGKLRAGRTMRPIATRYSR